ncbi:MAG TPA: acetylglutamate kinase, partial [Salinimicrobium sp.]|nr:acetylglutamate kinase [Salinimicrobium sp.]
MEKRKLKVIKIGGKLIEDQHKFDGFLKDFTSVKEDRILIHGGGAMASDLCGRLGIETKIIDGRRI